jgi:hypothetical protein
MTGLMHVLCSDNQNDGLPMSLTNPNGRFFVGREMDVIAATGQQPLLAN